MKSLQRYLIPVFVLAALALGAFGVAFAREISGSQINTVTSSEVEFTGVVDIINGNTWIIDGRTVLVDVSTELKSFISAGQTVKVHASMESNGTLVAREIELAGTAGVEDANANDNMYDDAFEEANDNEGDDAFEVENANDNLAGIMDNANDNSEDEHLGENSNDNSSLNEDNSNDNSSWNDDNSNDNSSIGEDDNSQGVSHDGGHDNHQDDSANHDGSGHDGGGDDHGDD